MVATRTIENMKSFYSYIPLEGVSTQAENETGKERKFTVRLKDIVINDTDKDISNFYAPDLKFFLFPMVWDESGNHIQCRPQESFETLSDLGNIVFGSNNTREISDKNQTIFLSDNVQGSLNMVFMGIVFDRKAELSKKLMRKIKSEIRKSKLNKLVKSMTDFDNIDEHIVILFEQLRKKIDGITKIYWLVNYKNNEKIRSCSSPCSPFFLSNDKLNMEIEFLNE